MNRIRKIIDALRVLSHSPAGTIHRAWCAIEANINSDEPKGDWSTDDVDQATVLIKTIVAAVVDIAEDDEAKAAGPGSGTKDKAAAS